MQRGHTYKIAISKYQARCKQSSEVFVKIQKKNIFFLEGSGRGDVPGGGGGRVGGVRVDVNEELKFL